MTMFNYVFLYTGRDQAGTNLNAVFEAFSEKMAIIKQREANFKEHQHVIIIFTDGSFI